MEPEHAADTARAEVIAELRRQRADHGHRAEQCRAKAALLRDELDAADADAVRLRAKAAVIDELIYRLQHPAPGVNLDATLHAHMKQALDDAVP